MPWHNPTGLSGMQAFTERRRDRAERRQRSTAGSVAERLLTSSSARLTLTPGDGESSATALGAFTAERGGPWIVSVEGLVVLGTTVDEAQWRFTELRLTIGVLGKAAVVDSRPFTFNQQHQEAVLTALVDLAAGMEVSASVFAYGTSSVESVHATGALSARRLMGV